MIVLHSSRGSRPVAPAFLLDEGTAVTEDGRRLSLDAIPSDVRVFCRWEQADAYARAGVGEMVAWGEEPIRWRHRRHGDAHRRRTDVVLVKIPVDSDGIFRAGVIEWADWLRQAGTAPGWSLGGSSMALLRSTLERELVTTNGELPPSRWTLGGRQQCWHEPGTSHAGLVQLDLQAAYTHVIGGLRYGGVWRRIDDPGFKLLETLHGFALPILAYALVRLPDGLRVGPLPRRPRERPEHGVDELAPNVPYPVSGRLSGLFSYAELVEAREAGATVRVRVAYIHAGSDRPFERWHDLVMQGREIGGYGGALAKATGNALWGQLVIDDRKLLAVQRWDRGRYSRLPVQGSKGHAIRAWDIGELVCGTVRAELYRALRIFAPWLVAAHTDGFWTRETPLTDVLVAGLQERGWRVKGRAAQLDLLDQQKYRYRVPRGRRWHYIVSGSPGSRAEETFDRLWDRFTVAERAA